MAIQSERTMTVAEYLEWEERQELRHEYIDGDIIEMSGGTGEHSMIIGNIHGFLWNRLSFPQYTVHTSNMRIKFSPTRYVYPDLSVVRGENVYDDASRLNLLNPVFVVEVTSPSSAKRDRMDKLDNYFDVPSIEAYLIVDQDRSVRAPTCTRVLPLAKRASNLPILSRLVSAQEFIQTEHDDRRRRWEERQELIPEILSAGTGNHAGALALGSLSTY